MEDGLANISMHFYCPLIISSPLNIFTINHGCQLRACRLTVSACRGKHSRIPPPLEGQLEAGWHRTRMGCVCQCDRPCVCTGPSPQGHPRRACSPRSPRRCPRHSSPLCSFSGGSKNDVVRLFFLPSALWDVKMFATLFVPTKGTKTFSYK